MAKVLGESSVTLEGKVYTLRFDMNVLADLEEETGLGAVELISALQDKGGSMKMIRKVCHAMLQRHHPEAGLEVAGDILTEDMNVVMAVINAAMPEAKPDKPGNVRAAAGRKS